jgi:hypothetical protein
MTEYIHLVGAEEVTRAASQMSSAAEEMKRAAMNIDDALSRNQRFMDEWLYRLEALVKKVE